MAEPDREELKVREWIARYVNGELSFTEFLLRVRQVGIVDLDAIQLDVDRRRRCGFPEVVYGEGKSLESLERVFRAMVERGIDVLATRISQDKAEVLLSKFPGARYNPVGRTFRIPLPTSQSREEVQGRVTIVTAGTTDLPVAEEARETAEWTGAQVTMVQDVGVAGPHRLQANLHLLEQADAVVVVAGMEGALPSVVGGYVSCPVIGVPTSVGYGASFAGVAALLSMLNSCAANVTVVNIDAGFKGGYIAGLIARNAARARAGLPPATVSSR
ncbi:MAG: nickel pincer cofactor biosynthesis protein LarB [Thermoguttaceae bacterium]|nr:nickel pincer cofactor biosynthesis protein LarB [Thermoguttaceae bacterium]MDW8079130.1 nickel pincer cofactor biosynthesis protein LarB [Thermoguttaceae bacterium]